MLASNTTVNLHLQPKEVTRSDIYSAAPNNTVERTTFCFQCLNPKSKVSIECSKFYQLNFNFDSEIRTIPNKSVCNK